MTVDYLNQRLTPSYSVYLQISFGVSPGDGLQDLPSSPDWL
jgi:hypothetical protein